MKRLLLPLLALLAGCGGGGTSGSPVRLTVSWPARSRDLDALSAAQSAVVRVVGGDAHGGDLVYTINRRTDPAAYSAEAVAPAASPPGTYELQITLCALDSGKGAQVGLAYTTVTVNPDGSTPATIVVQDFVDSVAILPGQSIRVGQRADLGVGVAAASGATIAVTPGAIFYTVVSGADHLRIDAGQPLGFSPGDATLIATVDGRASVPQTITVVP